MTYAADPVIFYGVAPGNMDTVWIECEDGSFVSPNGGKPLDLASLQHDEYHGCVKRVCRHDRMVKINEYIGVLCLGCKTVFKI